MDGNKSWRVASRERGELTGKGQERTILGDGNGNVLFLFWMVVIQNIQLPHIVNHLRICILFYINHTSINPCLSQKKGEFSNRSIDLRITWIEVMNEAVIMRFQN